MCMTLKLMDRFLCLEKVYGQILSSQYLAFAEQTSIAQRGLM